MNFTLFSDQFAHYPTFILLLLSVCMALIIVIFMLSIYQAWRRSTSFIDSELSEILSLLIFPSTYQEGLAKLKDTQPYKYFLPLIQELVTRQRNTGANLRPSFEDLKRALHKDLQFENELRIFMKESCLQYLSYVIFSWLLCFIFMKAEFVLPSLYYWSISFLHGMGFILLYYYMSLKLKKMSTIFNLFVPVLYRVIISFESKLVYQVKNSSEKNLPSTIKRFHFQLEKLITRRNNYGISITQELQLLSQDFWFYWGETCKETKTSIDRMKFALVMIVFGGAFMLILFGLTSVLVSGVIA
jgi:hypothetical protein